MHTTTVSPGGWAAAVAGKKPAATRNVARTESGTMFSAPDQAAEVKEENHVEIHLSGRPNIEIGMQNRSESFVDHSGY